MAQTKRTQGKPTLMILGTYHMANPGQDLINLEADDVLAPKRQQEIEELVRRLKVFRPTKIAVEVDPQDQDELHERYRAYCEGRRALERTEVEQIGFRLARTLGHPRLYPVDWFRDEPIDPKDVDFFAFAREHGQQPLLDRIFAEGERHAAKEKAVLEQGTVSDLLRYLNHPSALRRSHRVYFTIARIGEGDRYPGAQWVQHWYGRNLKIFINLTRLVESPDDRILLIIGAGHVYLLRQFAKESGFFQLESPLRYLRLDS